MLTAIQSLAFLGLILLYLLIISAVYAVYFIINRWITKIIAVKKEQNELLKEAIKLLDKMSNK